MSLSQARYIQVIAIIFMNCMSKKLIFDMSYIGSFRIVSPLLPIRTLSSQSTAGVSSLALRKKGFEVAL